MNDRTPLALLRKLPVGFCAFVLVVGMLSAIPGCTSKSTPPPEGQVAIEDVVKWYQMYREFNGKKAPANEKAFVDFIALKLKDRGTPMEEIQKLLISPRDGEKWVVLYGKPAPANPERSVAVHEKVGYDGKKLVAFEFGYSQEVDDAELQKFLALK